ncbi:uncharacterized protein LOC111712875 [Eurytemora carolleeae]|uniref:uncharacterized protein LOC111712875 n=1 Tax=Eurytemora carolleeae TaxID=1294199 RepID=UPI000C776EB9|nr:uncharacterized protein LOC111712875 [Eurytemora carolleeae]|eukprot:XP_023343395.1 uncharacterized protein LOC111712875 [Eurytemora affinis]
MKSFQQTRAMRKFGFIPVSEDENGCIRINLFEPVFLVLLVVRCMFIGAYLYFVSIYALQQEMFILNTVLLSINVLASCGTFFYSSLLIALAAERLGNNTFTGKSHITLKTFIAIITPQLLYAAGCVLNQLPLFTLDISWVSKCVLSITLIFVNSLALIDIFLLVSTCYLWVLDFKMKIAELLNQDKATIQINNFEKINNDYLSLKHALEPATFAEFSFVQLLCVVSVYLAFKGNIYNLLQFISMLMILVLMVRVLSDLYELMEKVADKAEEVGLEQSNLRSMFRYKQMSGKMRRAGLFTGLGYFTIEFSTITALLATTLTYLIVLLQSNF